MRYVEIRRHTDNEGDALTPDGVAAAERLGRTGLHPPYAAVVSTGAQRATQLAEILAAATGQRDLRVTEVPHLRSSVEDRWRDAAKAAGPGADVEAMRAHDPELVEKETSLLGGVLGRVLADLPDGGRALVIGHSPTNEAAVLGLTGQPVAPLGKGEGVLVVEDGGRYQVTRLEP